MPDGTVSQITGIAAELDQTDRTIEEQQELLDELQSVVEQGRSEVGELDAEQIVSDWLKEWSSNFFRDSYDAFISWHSPPTVQYPSRGDALPSVAKEILKDCPYAERVLVIHANDTSDSGKGYLYQLDDDGEFEKVDEWAGYEGAVGRDVAGYFREEHRISGLASPH